MIVRLSDSPYSRGQPSNEIGAAVRRFRLRAGLSSREVARRIRVAASYVSKVELGQRIPRLSFADRIAQALRLSSSERELLRTFLAIHRAEHRSTIFGEDNLRVGQTAIRRLEAEARSFKTFQLSLVPGLLQTPDYMRAILRRLNNTSHIGPAVTARVARQAMLKDGRRSFEFLIADWALAPHWCSNKVMSDQLRHLERMAKHPHVGIRVLARDAQFSGTVRPLVAGVEILDRAIVIMDTLTGFTTIRGPDDVDAHVATFDQAFAQGISS